MRIFLLVLFCVCSSLAAQEINDVRFNFTARVPAGFKPWPNSRPMPSGSTIYCYYLGDLDDDQPEVVIGFEHLGGVLGRERLDVKDVPGGLGLKNATVERETWKDLEIDVFSTDMNSNGFDIHAYVAQVPLKPEAIQINIAGLATRKTEVREYLRFVLANLNGESNWLSEKERVAKLVEGVGKMAIFVAVVVVGIVLIVRARRKKMTPAAAYYPGVPAAGPGGFPRPRGYGPPGYQQQAFPAAPANQAPAYPDASAPVQRAAPAVEAEQVQHKCTSCGRPARPGRKSCMYCGANL